MSRILRLVLVLLIAFWSANAGAASVAAPRCGIQSCHGLNVTCGPNQPQACTALYRIGDFCREFLHCAFVEGECRLITDERFQPCKDCVEECTQKAQGPAVLGCEGACRKELEYKFGPGPGTAADSRQELFGAIK